MSNSHKKSWVVSNPHSFWKYEKRFFFYSFFFLFRSIWSWVATWKTRLKMSNLSRNCSVSCLICQAARHLGCANGRSSYHFSVKRFRYGFQTKGQLFDTIITPSYQFFFCFARQYVFFFFRGIELKKLLEKIDFWMCPIFVRSILAITFYPWVWTQLMYWADICHWV